ncbi:MAG: nucleotidyl transferase AbiEii/AbiGii toxin family protein [Candidatus Levybacteria bacterium]|nr:nucleotidyl transferase AbiEii/AbiGii toxin family protein [Candidatus Levybacteria bacterium]
MLTLDKLKQLAVKNQTTVLNTQREYIQHLFLSYFYRQTASSQIFFKGGTALRLLYNSPRFSQDLDFSSQYKDIKRVEDAVIATLSEIEREGIQTEIIESKKTTGGYLATIEFKLSSQEVSIQIEISNRERDLKADIVTVVSDFIPSYTVLSLKLQSLVNEKLDALLTRKKPRDFYDLYFMLRARLISPSQREVLEVSLIQLKKTTINFENELKQFLPKTHWAIIRNFKQTLEKEIEKFI